MIVVTAMPEILKGIAHQQSKNGRQVDSEP